MTNKSELEKKLCIHTHTILCYFDHRKYRKTMSQKESEGQKKIPNDLLC